VKPDQLVNLVYKANREEMVILDQLENEVLAVLLDSQKMANKVKKEIKVLLDYQVIADSAANLERSVIKEHEVFLVSKALEDKKVRKGLLVQSSKELLAELETQVLLVSLEELGPLANLVFQV